MYEKIKAEISQDYYQKNFANDGQRFIAWYLRNIYNLDPVEATECITDGAGDKQIDAVYIDNENSTIYIMQGKFYQGGTIDSEPLREVLSSWIQIKDLQKLQDAANTKLKVKIQDISSALDDDYDICFELITTSALTKAAQDDLKAFQEELVEDSTLSANFVLVDDEILKGRYDEALNKTRPYINHAFTLLPDKFVQLELGGTKAVIAAIPLKDCLKIPGIKDGSLFRKNVRQSLGNSNRVNKGIAQTLKNDPKSFFFLHNGITAICKELTLKDNVLHIKELNVVNGCQSLNTIYNCSESVRNIDDGFIMFRFYEITDADRADKISTSTNSQSAVKARDLRSNDKAVLMLKKTYQQKYPDGYFKTKRGETVNSAQYNDNHVIDLTALGKQLIAWHSQRPTISYSESKIFDKYFNQLFHKDYPAENIQALHDLFERVYATWIPDNPMGMNESLLAMKAYASYHHLYTISVICKVVNKMPGDTVPNPYKLWIGIKNDEDSVKYLIKLAALCLNTAFNRASEKANENGKVFSPQNWVKAKASLNDIKDQVSAFIGTLQLNDSDNVFKKMSKDLILDKTDFSDRWTAD